MTNNEEKNKFRYGVGLIREDYVMSSSSVLKDFKRGDEVVIWHVDDFYRLIDYLMDRKYSDIAKCIIG